MMDLNIKGKYALVTGAGRGLGRAICKTLCDNGVNIIAVSRGKDGLDDLQNSLDPALDHQFFLSDLELENSTQDLIAQLDSMSLSPDIIVNNAGGNLGFTDPLKTSEGWRQVMRLNVEAAIEINERYIPDMKENKWGRICHISSIAALENQGPPAYCAAKAALNAYVRSLARYVSEDNVILTSVMPGAVFTDGGYWDDASANRPEHVEKYLNERMAIKRFGTVNEISDAVAFLCSDLSGFCVGTCMLIDGGQGRVFYPDLT
jgi:3-oxoacyl-[acyl-carrier protein] reductase